MLSLAIVLSLLATPGAECPPAVVAQGALGAELAEALRRREVQVPPPTGCEGLAVEVGPAAGGVSLRPAVGPARVVPDLETAALLVETWVRAELIDPLLAARRGPPPPAPRLITADLGLDAAVASDGSAWLAGRAEGCIALGDLCPGVRVRMLYDPGVTGESQRTDVWRLGLGVLAVTDWVVGPLRAGMGVGAAVVRIDGKQGLEDTRGAPLFEARIGAAVPLSDALALDVGVAGNLGLWPRHGRSTNTELPGMPQWMALGGLGLRWRVP